MQNTLLAGLAALITATTIPGAEPKPDTARAIHPTDPGHAFMMNAKIGIFVHYRSGQSDFAYGKPNPQPWDLDAHADTFDVNAFADAVEDIGAQYVIMTSFHASMKIEQKTRPWPMVRMDSADGSTVYVHVLIPQAAGAQARDGFRDLGALQTYNTNKEQVVSRRRHEEHEALKDESNSPSCSS